MRLLVAAGAEIDAVNDFGATPLMWAIGEPEKVRILVAAGADVNARSKMGRTPLYLAAANDGSSATVKLLLEHGAKVEMPRSWRPPPRTTLPASACCSTRARMSTPRTRPAARCSCTPRATAT